MSTLDDRLMPVFARQHWLVSIHDVRAAGGDLSAAARRVKSGRWAAADVGVYRLVGPSFTWHGRLLAPLLAFGEPAVASHHAAAALHGFPGFGRGAPELSLPRSAGGRLRTQAILHTSTDLDRSGRVVVESIPSTGVERTILDLARRTGDQRLLETIEWCRRKGHTDWSSMIRVLVAHARRGRPGIRRLRRVIAANMSREEITDSDFELLVLALLRERGLPEPVLHHRVHDEDGRFVAEVDLAYPRWKIAIELDGKVHLEEQVWEADQPRQNDLVLEGWIVLRFSWRRYRTRPDALVAEIRTALRQAGAFSLRPPSTDL